MTELDVSMLGIERRLAQYSSLVDFALPGEAEILADKKVPSSMSKLSEYFLLLNSALVELVSLADKHLVKFPSSWVDTL